MNQMTAAMQARQSARDTGGKYAEMHRSEGDLEATQEGWPRVPDGTKRFDEMSNVGTAKYVVNTHDGHATHRDGSPFFGIAIFSNRREKDRYVRQLEREGYLRGR